MKATHDGLLFLFEASFAIYHQVVISTVAQRNGEIYLEVSLVRFLGCVALRSK